MTSVEFHTGFEGCNSTDDIVTFFNRTQSDHGVIGYSENGGYLGSRAMYLSGTIANGYYSIFRACTSAKTKSIGTHVSINNYVSDTPLLSFIGPNVYIRVPGGGDGISIYRDATKIADSSGTPIPLNTQTHIECKVFSDGSSGTVQVWINGYLILNATGLNTGGQDITEIGFTGRKERITYFDDIFIADDWVGDSTTVLKLPNSDALVAFTPSAGTDNFAMVAETERDNDATYVDAIVTSQDLYGFEDIDLNDNVVAVSLISVNRKTGAGKYPVLFHHVAKQDSTEYHKSDKALGVEYQHTLGSVHQDQYPTAPDGSAWTPAIWNAMQFGFKATLTSP